MDEQELERLRNTKLYYSKSVESYKRKRATLEKKIAKYEETLRQCKEQFHTMKTQAPVVSLTGFRDTKILIADCEQGLIRSRKELDAIDATIEKEQAFLDEIEKSLAGHEDEPKEAVVIPFRRHDDRRSIEEDSN